MLPLADFGVKWFGDIINRLILWFTQSLTGGYEALSQETLSTPTPAGSGIDRVFGQPDQSDAPWYGIYEATVAGEIMVFALLILFLCVQGRHFIRIFDLGSVREHRRTRRSALTGGFLIISWYWVGTLTLYVVEALTIGLLPNVARISGALMSMLPTAPGTPIMTVFMASVGAFSIVILRALFFIREILLYVFMYVMPIGIAVAYGNIPVVSEIARRISVQFVALAILPLPTALLFRGFGLLFAGPNQIPLAGPFSQYLAVIALPVVSVYVTWKTFSYAAPLASRTLSRTGRGAVLLGSIGAAASVTGPQTAALAARWGTKGAAGAMLSKRYGPQPPVHTESVAQPSEQHPQGGVPEYRRKENDPGYY